MANPGAVSKDHLEWLDFEKSDFSDFELRLIAELLLRSPAIDVTRFSTGFVERFGVATTDAAEALLEDLTQDLVLYPDQESAEDLRSVLIKQDLLNGEFWRHGEFILMTINVPNYVAIDLTAPILGSNGALSEQRAACAKRRYRRLDALFRHIRNALAHGQFQRKDNLGDTCYIFQDANIDGNISARMVLSEERLQNWITRIYYLDTIGV